MLDKTDTNKFYYLVTKLSINLLYSILLHHSIMRSIFGRQLLYIIDSATNRGYVFDI